MNDGVVLSEEETLIDDFGNKSRVNNDDDDVSNDGDERVQVVKQKQYYVPFMSMRTNKFENRKSL